MAQSHQLNGVSVSGSLLRVPSALPAQQPVSLLRRAARQPLPPGLHLATSRVRQTESGLRLPGSGFRGPTTLADGSRPKIFLVPSAGRGGSATVSRQPSTVVLKQTARVTDSATNGLRLIGTMPSSSVATKNVKLFAKSKDMVLEPPSAGIGHPIPDSVVKFPAPSNTALPHQHRTVVGLPRTATPQTASSLLKSALLTTSSPANGTSPCETASRAKMVHTSKPKPGSLLRMTIGKAAPQALSLSAADRKTAKPRRKKSSSNKAKPINASLTGGLSRGWSDIGLDERDDEKKPKLSWDVDLLGGDDPFDPLPEDSFVECEKLVPISPPKVKKPVSKGGVRTLLPQNVKRNPKLSATTEMSDDQWSKRSNVATIQTPKSVSVKDRGSLDSVAGGEEALQHIDEDWAVIKKSLETRLDGPLKDNSLKQLNHTSSVKHQEKDSTTSATKGQTVEQLQVEMISNLVNDRKQERKRSASHAKRRGRQKKETAESKQPLSRKGMSDYWKHKILSPEHTSTDDIAMHQETVRHIDEAINSVVAGGSPRYQEPLSPVPSSRVDTAPGQGVKEKASSPTVPSSPATTPSDSSQAPLDTPFAEELTKLMDDSISRVVNKLADDGNQITQPEAVMVNLENGPILPKSFELEDSGWRANTSIPELCLSPPPEILTDVRRDVMKLIDTELVKRIAMPQSLSKPIGGVIRPPPGSFSLPFPVYTLPGCPRPIPLLPMEPRVVELKTKLPRPKLIAMTEAVFHMGATYTEDFAMSGQNDGEIRFDENLEYVFEPPESISSAQIKQFLDESSADVFSTDATVSGLCKPTLVLSNQRLVFIADSCGDPPTNTSTSASLQQKGASVSPHAALSSPSPSECTGADLPCPLPALYTPPSTSSATSVCSALPFQMTSSSSLSVASPVSSTSVPSATDAFSDNDALYRCNCCSACFSALSEQLHHELLQHMVLAGRLVCLGCPLVARFEAGAAVDRQIDSLLRHYVQHVDPASGRLTRVTSAQRLPCSSCPRTFASGSLYGQHELLCPHQMPSVCSSCRCRFSSLDALRLHELEHMRDMFGKYSCDMCACKFGKVEQFAAHRRFHFKEKKIECQRCGKMFISEGMLNMHMKWKHSDGPCRFCPRQFTSATARKVHEEHSHLKYLPHMCDQCSLRVVSPAQLRVHKRTHSTEPLPHACSQCDCRFVSRGLLRKHMASHVLQQQPSAVDEQPNTGESPQVNVGVETQPDVEKMGDVVEDVQTLRRMFDMYRRSFSGMTAGMTLSDLDTDSDEEEQQNERDIAATHELYQQKDRKTKSVWSCPICKMYFTKLWGVRAHITLKHPGSNASPTLHDASQSTAISKKAFLRELKRNVRQAKKKDKLALKVQDRLVRFGSAVPRRGRPMKNPLFPTRPRRPPLADGTPRKRGRPRKVPTPAVDVDAGGVAAAAASSPVVATPPVTPAPKPAITTPTLPDRPPKGMVERRRWQCLMCDVQFSTHGDMVTHSYTSHPDLSLPEFRVVVEHVSRPSTTPGSTAAHSSDQRFSTATGTPSSGRHATVRGRAAARRGRGGTGDRGRGSDGAGDLYRRQYKTAAASRRRGQTTAARGGQKLYCYCQVPYDEGAEMIGCDNDHCTYEWFHFKCVDVVVAPKGSWFCSDCSAQK